ncbi:hypothetical protein F4777DRAFT_568636 [Nemania sp. FL0916]|nr:hypothetical protein F4777DRAFT_568636 [Nemania sp. FL0916]
MKRGWASFSRTRIYHGSIAIDRSRPTGHSFHMFTVRNNRGRALFSPLRLRVSPQHSLFSSTCRRLAIEEVPAAEPEPKTELTLQAKWPIAEQLYATGLYHKGRKGTKPKKPPPKTRSRVKGDQTRVNIVSDQLCDDVFSYIGSSLERHRGCDILDIYPGAGLWSSKLHEFLQPRSHVMLEPDVKLYRSFLQPLLEKPGTKLIPKSGIVWPELNSVLTPEFLPHQVLPDEPDARNDTLLVTANLAFQPKRRFLGFDSIATLVLHQFIDAIRTKGLFQRYGNIRMLLWVRTDDNMSFLPRNIQRRKRQSIDNGLLCEWVQEVCGGEASASKWFMREDALDQASLWEAAKRMREAGIETPRGRFTSGLPRALIAVDQGEPYPIPGELPPEFQRSYLGDWAELKAKDTYSSASNDEDFQRGMTLYEWRASGDAKRAERLHRYYQAVEGIVKLRQAPNPNTKELAEATAKYEADMARVPKTLVSEFLTYKDNLRSYRRHRPLLMWDKRAYEPMTVQDTEFFPNVECSLLDIQPRTPHPLLRQTGPKSSRASETFGVIMALLMQQATHPLGPALDSFWPGASDYIMPRWTTGLDLARGGFAEDLRYWEATPRLMGSEQWEQLLELWMEWPFHPQFHELIGRTSDDFNAKMDDAPPPEF